jgi:formylmethanofuran dehydrogenase subunit B
VLREASRPLIYLAPDVSCEAQRAAIAIADALHAAIDTVTSATALDSVLAAQEAGRASATLGEIRNRADVVVFWGVDPGRRYPRFATRYAPEPAGLHVGPRRVRVVVAVDVGSARGPEDADVRLPLMPDREIAALTRLTAALATGIAHDSFLQTLVRAKYVAIVVDAEADDEHPAERGRAAALIAFSQALNAPTRCALISLRGGGNRSGADACLGAQTGYPMAVDFSRGFPRYQPHNGAAARIARGAVDAVLIIGSAGKLPELFAAAARGIPSVAIGPRASESPFATGTVAIDTGIIGIHESGVALRMDDVPLPLGAAIAGPPCAAEVVADLAGRVTPAAVARAAANRQ